MPQNLDGTSSRFSPDRIRGLYFDLAVFLGNLVLLPPMARLIRGEPDAGEGSANVWGGLLFLAAFAAQAAGAYLKRPGLQARLARRNFFQGKPWTQLFGGSVTVLLILHYLVFCCILAFGISNLLPPGFDVEKHDAHPAFFATVIVFLIVAALPTIVAACALMPYGRSEKKSSKMPLFPEFLADAFLYFSVQVVVSFWSELLLGAVYRGPQEGGFHPVFAVSMTLLLALPFFMFYVVPRLLFLVEDSRYVGTWIRMFIAMLPVSYHLLKG